MTERDAKLDARYRELAIEEPSIVIDDAIRAAARRAVATRRASFEKRWAMPVSIAAVLVLAVGVTLRVQLERPGVEVPTVENAAPSAALAERAQAPAMTAPAAPAASSAPAGAAASPAPAKPFAAEIDTMVKKNAAPEPKAQAESKPKLDSQDFMRQKKDEARRDESVAAQIAPPPRPAPEPKREIVPFPAQATPPASSMARADPAPSAAAAPTAVLTPAPAPAAAALRKEEISGALASQSAPKAREVEAIVTGEKAAADKFDANVATGRVGFAAPPAKTMAAAGAREAPLERDRAATPEKELERIAELRRVGRHTEADDLLARFKREHPDYRIAEDLWEKVRPQ